MSEADRALAPIAARQHGLITRPQALAVLSGSAVDRRLRGGRWVPLERRVYLIGGAPVTWRVKVLAACLATGGVASHRSAAVLYGLDGFREGRPEVSVPVRSRFASVAARVHQSSDFDRFRARSIDHIPMTPPSRLAVDLGGVVPYGVYERAVDELVATRRLTWDDAAHALLVHARPGRTGVGALRQLLDARFGTDVDESALERAFDRIYVASALPRPIPQYEVFDRGRLVARVDYAYPGHLIAIELDSLRFHLNATAFAADRAKRNHLKALGWTVLEFTWADVMSDAADVLDVIDRTLAVRS